MKIPIAIGPGEPAGFRWSSPQHYWTWARTKIQTAEIAEKYIEGRREKRM